MKNVGTRRTVTMLVSLALLAGASVAFTDNKAAAQTAWPTRAVTLVVPFAPGASNDTFTRAIATVLSRKFGQPFVVENRPGAAGYTATSQVQRAAPDGYTFLQMPNGIAFLPALDEGRLRSVIRHDSAGGVRARADCDGRFRHAAGENRAGVHRLRQEESGHDVFWIHRHRHDAAHPRRTVQPDHGFEDERRQLQGIADAQTDLVAGRLQVMFVTVASVAGQLPGGQLKLLAYAADTSPPSAPRAPLLSEAGVKGMESQQIWWGFFAPKDVPADVLKKMNEGINEALKDPAVIELFAKSGASPVQTSLEQALKEVKDEVTTYARIVKEAGIKFE